MSSSPPATRRALVWVALAIVLVVALLIGSGVFSSRPLTQAQRVQAIASGIKCPSCEDLSVADSNAQTAVTVRRAIAAQVSAGRTDQQIDDYLSARYGSSIVLTPPTSGWSLLVWLLPLVAGIVAVAGLTVFVVRRRRRGFAPDADTGTTAADGDPGIAVLADRRLFLQRSLADAQAEFDAGDLAEADFDALCRRDRGRLEAVEARMEALEREDSAPGPLAAPATVSAVAPASGATTSVPDTAPTPGSDPAPRPPRSRRQRFLLGGSVVALSAAIVLVVVLVAVPRQPGQTETGNVTLSQQQKVAENLAAAAVDEDAGNFSQAAQLYNQILSQDPHQAQATAQ
ncbi:MAG TPA: cytochrome c-type biogenesis protein CcmH, partial [Acidimicrobiales bacterium]|nr:cytochrome c-type biogenesis protein CcmH [Acidimicrobiales bacterium]